jgi:hypothetical protein
MHGTTKESKYPKQLWKKTGFVTLWLQNILSITVFKNRMVLA